jgi:hypothetical protein
VEELVAPSARNGEQLRAQLFPVVVAAMVDEVAALESALFLVEELELEYMALVLVFLPL